MKKYFFVLLISLSFQYNAQVMWQLKTDTVIKWFYYDGDEFNTASVDTSKWDYASGSGNANIKQDLYFTNGENTYQKGGISHFVADKTEFWGHVWPWEYDTTWLKKNNILLKKDSLPFHYKAGQLISKEKYAYGYFECRFKSNNEKGIWPAFWMYAGHENDELDWFELKGERPDQFHVDAHCATGCDDYRGGFLNLVHGWGGWLKTNKKLSDGFNIISGEWNWQYAVWYFNGKAIAYIQHDFRFPMLLIINTNVAADHEAFNPGPDKTTKFPNEFLVDYVRIWTSADSTKQDNTEKFFVSGQTLKDQNKNIKVSRKINAIYNKKILSKEKGTITMLPLGNKIYSFLFNMPEVLATVEIKNDKEDTVKTFNIKTPYFEADLSDLKPGSYEVALRIGNRICTHHIKL